MTDNIKTKLIKQYQASNRKDREIIRIFCESLIDKRPKESKSKINCR